MRSLSALLPLAGLMMSPVQAGKDIVYSTAPTTALTTVWSSVYTTYCPEPTTFTHRNHTYTVTTPTTICITETSTSTPTTKPYYNTTYCPPESTTKPPHNTTKTYPPTTLSPSEKPPTKTPVSPSSTKPPVVEANKAQVVGTGAGGALAIGMAVAAFML